MDQKTEALGDSRARLAWWFKGIGIVLLVSTFLLVVRLVWEQTYLSWQNGPQMVGFSLLHGHFFFLFFSPVLLAVWLAAALMATLVAEWKKKRVSPVRWITILLSALLLGSLFIPYSLWQRAFVGQIAESPQAVAFLNQAADVGDVELVEALLLHGVSVNSSLPYDHRTPLHAAAVAGQTHMVEFLIASGADVNALDRTGHSPLALAESAEMKEVLLSNGAMSIDGYEYHYNGTSAQENGEDPKLLEEPEK